MTNWGAAPRTPRRAAYRFSALIVLTTALAVLTAAPAQAAPDTSTAPTALPGSVWGFEVNRASYRMLGPRLARRLRTHGVNALVVRPGSLQPAQVARVRNLARAAHLLVFAPLAEERPSSAVSRTAADTACRALELASPGSRCAVYARTLGSARQLTASGAADVVVVPSTMRSLRTLHVSGGRVVVMLTIPAKKHFKQLRWRRAAVRSKASRNVDLAAGPTTQRGAVDAYLSALKPIAPSGDRVAPTTPKNLATTDATASRTAFTWSPSSDNKKVAGYGVYLDGARQKDVKSTTAYLPRLTCGAPHLLEVDAYDAAGNRSAKAAMSASSGDCVPPPPPAGGLVAAYGFEETTGASATDASGYANTGTLAGATRTTGGRFGGGLRFDGVDDQVSVLDDETLDLTNAMTLEAWVRPTSALSGWRTVVLKEQPGDLVYGLYASASGYLPSGHVFVAGDDKRVSAPAALPADTWSHLATTYDGTTLRLYVNGTPAGELALSGPLTASSGVLRIGGNLVWDEWFAGTIDEVRVYDRALSASEVQGDMADPVGTPAPGDTQAPTTPGNFRSPSATGSSVSLAWNSATDDVGVTEYAVYRGGNLVGTGLGTTRTVTGLACGTTYSFAVEAADAAGNRSAQATLNAATVDCPTGPDTEAPTAPTGLAKTGSTQTSISVSWTAVERQHRRERLRRVPRRRADRDADGHHVHLHRPRVRYDVRPGRRRRRRGRQPLGTGDAERVDQRVPAAARQRGAHDAGELPLDRRDDHERLARVERRDRQHRRDRLRRLPEREPRQLAHRPDGHGLRPLVRDELHVRRRRRRRRDEPLDRRRPSPPRRAHARRPGRPTATSRPAAPTPASARRPHRAGRSPAPTRSPRRVTWSRSPAARTAARRSTRLRRRTARRSFSSRRPAPR